jgi:hypothetical protein
MPRKSKFSKACKLNSNKRWNCVEDKLHRDVNPLDAQLPRDANPLDEQFPRDSTPLDEPIPRDTNPLDEQFPRDSTPLDEPIPRDANYLYEEIPRDVNTLEEQIPRDEQTITPTKKRKLIPVALEYITPKKNHPVLSKFRTPRSKRDILKPKLRTPAPEGRRIFTIGAVESALNAAIKHKSVCTAANMFIKSEKRIGLQSKLEVKCTNCNRPSIWISTDDEHCSVPINEAVVWGANVTGAGYTSFKHSMAALDVPFMSNTSFIQKEKVFSDKLDVSMRSQLDRNGEEEYQKCLELDQYITVDGVKIAWTFVTVDGQWSKRCYNQTGRANSGSACIIGLLTKKPLFVGVRNKFCLVCRTNKVNIPAHRCFKNWSGPSSAMEADIVAEGFLESVERHKLMYKFMIGDGDSSVHSEVRLVYHKPELEYTVVEKIECKNHAIRRMNKKLIALLTQRLYPSNHRKVLEEKISKIGKCCAYIIQNNVDKKPVTTSKTVKRDLENVLYHVFGDHGKCSSINCVDGMSVIPARMMKKKPSEDDTTRKKTSSISKILDLPIWHAMMNIVSKLASHSVSLMYDLTTNISESFQAHVNKLCGGRRTHVSAKGGYNRKVAAAAYSFEFGQAWYGKALRNITYKSPSALWKRMEAEAKRMRAQKKKPKACKSLLKRFDKPKYLSKTYIDADGDEYYGEGARKVDMTPEKLTAEIDTLRESLSVSSKAAQIEMHMSTLGQWDNPKFKQLRERRITASKCGAVFALRDTTSNVSTIDSILHSSFSGNEATAWGKINERRGIQCYEEENRLVVYPAGLFISLQHGALAASPDGLVGDDGIVEIKCPYLERYGMPEDVATRKSNKYLLKTGNTYTLSQTSHYYYQVVMQLHVSQREWCDFVVWTQGPSDSEDNSQFANPKGTIIITRIFRTDTNDVWLTMSQKLIRFWEEDLAPEIVDSRRARRDGYRQPLYRLNAINQAIDAKEARSVVYNDIIRSVIQNYEELPKKNSPEV